MGYNLPMHIENEWVKTTLADFLEAIPSDYPYFALGSLVLLSYTENFYTRPIRDIDLIGDTHGTDKLGAVLLDKGYAQNTFIDSKFPLAHKLQAIGKKKYLRFEKNGRALEIMTSNLTANDGSIDVELYPGIAVSMSESAVQNTRYQGLEFRAVSPEALFCIYNFGLKTWGTLVKTRIEQRRRDLAALHKIVQPYALTRIADNVHLKIGRSRIKIPSKLITT
ncbi:MAG: hypothetical protein UX82_C0010G0029 [Microgenomates group bacterium GW2011_GWE1_47_12]|nr:MAG: hypothetical protein UX82_C0010G0029 [Microgenomates group bacterium GW2011_GWE1_47_12]